MNRKSPHYTVVAILLAMFLSSLSGSVASAQQTKTLADLEREARARYEAERRRRQEQARLERERAAQLEREQVERLRAESAVRQKFSTTPEWDAALARNHAPEGRGDSLACRDGGFRKFLGHFESDGFGLAGSGWTHLGTNSASYAWDFLIEDLVRKRSPPSAPILQFAIKPESNDIVWKDGALPERAYVFDYAKISGYQRMQYASEEELRSFAIATTKSLTALTSRIDRSRAMSLLADSGIESTYKQALELYLSSNFHRGSTKTYELTWTGIPPRTTFLVNEGFRVLSVRSQDSRVQWASSDAALGKQDQSTRYPLGTYVCVPGLIQQRIVQRLDRVVTDQYGQQSVEPQYIVLIITDIPYTPKNTN